MEPIVGHVLRLNASEGELRSRVSGEDHMRLSVQHYPPNSCLREEVAVLAAPLQTSCLDTYLQSGKKVERLITCAGRIFVLRFLLDWRRNNLLFRGLIDEFISLSKRVKPRGPCVHSRAGRGRLRSLAPAAGLPVVEDSAM